MDVGQSSGNKGSEMLDTNVEIKIKTLDAQSYTLRVEKNTPVPALKERIASVVGVPVENQRLICRGKVLKDDQILSAYNVEDGHTLHLVARQPQQVPAPSVGVGGSANSGSNEGQDLAAAASGPSDLVIISPQNRPGHVSHSLLMGTINIPDAVEGGMPDLNRIISAVLNSVGLGNGLPGGGNGGSVTVGVLPPRAHQPPVSDGQLRSDGSERNQQASPVPGADQPMPRELELQIEALYGAPANGTTATAGTAAPSPFRFVQQPMVVPDALTTMSQYLDRLEQSFALSGARSQPLAGPTINQGANHAEGNGVSGFASNSTAEGGSAGLVSGGRSVPAPNPPASSERQDTGLAAALPAPARRLPTPQALGAIVRRVQELLSGHAGTAFARLASQLENEPNIVDPAARAEMQSVALRDGNMMQQLGALLLELGHTTLTLRLGQSPAESVVSAGPAIFISPSGPNPMMVQSLPLQTGVALGALPFGTSPPSGGFVGPSLGPRSINIHIHTSDLRLPSASPSPSPSSQQPPPRAVVGVASGAPVRQLIERAETTNPEHALTVRQIIERAEAASGAQGGNSELNSLGTVGGSVQGAIMTFNENGAMRVVPVRTRTAAVSGTSSNSRAPSESAAGVFQPLIARFQQQVGSVQQGRAPGVPAGTSLGNTGVTTLSGEQPAVPSVQPMQAPVQVQAWAPSVMQAVEGGHLQQLLPGEHMQVNRDGELGSAAGDHPVAGEGLTMPSQRTRVTIPLATNSSSHAMNSGDPQVSDGSRQVGNVSSVEFNGGVDVASIVHSLGPFLNQLAEAFQQARSQPTGDVPHSEQTGELPGVGIQQSMESNPSDLGVVPVSALTGDTELRNEDSSHQVVSSSTPEHSEHPELGSTGKSGDKMDVDNGTGKSSAHIEDPVSSSTRTLDAENKELGTRTTHDQVLVEDGGRVEDTAISTPIGLGLGGLQPLPARARRRPQGQQRQQQAGVVSAVNRLVSVRTNEQTPPAVLQNAMLHDDRPSDQVEANANHTEVSRGQLSQGLLPLLSSIGNRGEAHGDGRVDFGDILGQLIGRTGDGNTAQTPSASSILGGVVGQLAQSPLMENIVRQVMTSVGTEDAHNMGHSNSNSFAELGGRNHGSFDLAGMVQQMMPVVAQMFSVRPSPSGTDQAPGSGDGRGNEAQGNPRGGNDDTGRWRESLSEDEAAAWSETISADVEHQQSMAPQRPFSDVYARGSPVAKRQKTDLEGTAQKLENGGSPEDLLRSVAENAAAHSPVNNGSAVTTEEVSQLGQHVSEVDGLADAYMAVLFHDLAARVAADPDFGDGSRFPYAARVFQQQKAPQEPAGL